MSNLEAVASEKAKVDSQLTAANRQRAELEDKLRRAVRESEGIQHEVRRMFVCVCVSVSLCWLCWIKAVSDCYKH